MLAGLVAPLRAALVVVAHPDDESFGLGAVLRALVEAGMEVRLLCLTAGEASTVGAGPALVEERRREVLAAAEVLGLASVRLEALPDGRLSSVPLGELSGLVEEELGDARLLVGFERLGVTGHPDHSAATAAALRVALTRGLASLEWGVPDEIAAQLRAQVPTRFTGFARGAGDPRLVQVDRAVQERAIACHVSQDPHNLVLRARLALQGDREWLRLVHRGVRLRRTGTSRM
ncbi:MAG: PIG-L family deacetylase [Candidatus Dormibacteraeota bacterium]|nr:PIG-L family deacetylase [Candidatus Dormibacteraeota bacterium]